MTRARRTHWRHRAVVLSSAVVAGMLVAAPAEATPLECDDRAGVCADYSDLVLNLMETVAPGASERFATTLASGYRLDPATTVTCALHVSCDAWPVARAAASVLAAAADDACAVGGQPVCDAVAVAASEAQAGAVVRELRAAVAGASFVPVADRVPELAQRVQALIAEAGHAPEGREIADAIVGVVTLSMTLLPAGSAGTLLPRKAHTVGVETVAPEGAGGLDVETATPASGGPPGTVAAVAGAAVTGTKRCTATFDLFASLDTWDGSSFSTFEIWAYAGVHDLRWAYLNEVHTGCPRPKAEFDGSIFAEAISNAGSFIASSTKRSDLRHHIETLHFGPDYVAATYVHWETAKVEVKYDFPFAFVIDNYAPPVGNYRSSATGTVRMMNGYVFDTRTKATTRKFRFGCTKQGSNASVCSVKRAS